MSVELAAEVQRFILDHLSSVEQLETLVLMRAERQRQWTAEDVSRALYSSPNAVQMRLDELAAHGLVRAGDPSSDPGQPTNTPKTYCYDPHDPEKDRLLEIVVNQYRERRVAVIGLIYSKQSSQVQAFADAFRLRKD
jgi:hypothetical protein